MYSSLGLAHSSRPSLQHHFGEPIRATPLGLVSQEVASGWKPSPVLPPTRGLIRGPAKQAPASGEGDEVLMFQPGRLRGEGKLRIKYDSWTIACNAVTDPGKHQ